jgi:hypothetical protein
MIKPSLNAPGVCLLYFFDLPVGDNYMGIFNLAILLIPRIDKAAQL